VTACSGQQRPAQRYIETWAGSDTCCTPWRHYLPHALVWIGECTRPCSYLLPSSPSLFVFNCPLSLASPPLPSPCFLLTASCSLLFLLLSSGFCLLPHHFSLIVFHHSLLAFILSPLPPLPAAHCLLCTCYYLLSVYSPSTHLLLPFYPPPRVSSEREYLFS